MWLQDPVSACRGILMDPASRDYFVNFAEGSCGNVVLFHLKFFAQALGIRMAQGDNIYVHVFIYVYYLFILLYFEYIYAF